MYSKSYRDGYDGNLVNTGGNFVDYENGRLDRERQFGGGGGGNGCGLIILFIVFLPFLVISIVSAVVATPIIQLYLKKIDSNYASFSFKQLYVILLKNTAIYQLLTLVITTLTYLIGLWLSLSFFDIYDYTQDAIFKNDVHIPIALLPILCLFQFPTILVHAFVVRKNFKDVDKLSKAGGYVKSVVISGLIITPSVLFAGYIVLEASKYIGNM